MKGNVVPKDIATLTNALSDMIPIKELLLQEAIINILNNSSAKLKTRDILNALQDEGEWEEIDKKDINRLLYGPLEKDVRMDNNHRWSMVNGSEAEVTSNDGAVVKKLVGREQHVSDISVKWARTSTNHVFNKEEISIPSFFNVKTTKNNTVITINTKHPASNVLCELLNLQENKETDKEIGIEQASNIIEVLLKAWAYLEINSSDKRKQLLEDIRSDWGLTARDLLDSTEDVGTITVDRTVDNTETSNLDNSTFLEEPSVNISIREPNSLPSKPPVEETESNFAELLSPSEALAKIIGSSPLPRTEVNKKIWKYIKNNGLQDRHNKRMINADEHLKVVFDGRGQVSMFEMTKLVTEHLRSIQ